MLRSPEPPSFENTIKPLEEALTETNYISGLAYAELMTGAGKKMKPAAWSCLGLSGNFEFGTIYTNELYQRVKSVVDQSSTLGLDDGERRLSEAFERRLVEYGAALSSKARSQSDDLKSKLFEVGAVFDENLARGKFSFRKLVKRESLSGLSEDWIERAEKRARAAGQEGGCLVTDLDASDIFSFCANRALRKEMWKARREKNGVSLLSGERSNAKPILKMLELRAKLAKLNGFPNFASMQASRTSLKTEDGVAAWLDRHIESLKPRIDARMKTLRALARKDGIETLEECDVDYYQEKAREETFGQSAKELRTYEIKLDHAEEVLFRAMERQFDIEIRPTVVKYPTYSPDVNAYEVFDKRAGKVMAVYYTNLSNAENRVGSAEFVMRAKGLWQGEEKLPLVLTCFDFKKPLKGEEKTISLNDVVALYHEFGHGLQKMFGADRFATLNDSHPENQHEEFYSMLNENRMQSKETVQDLFRHKKTGEKLPERLVEAALATSSRSDVLWSARQAYYAQIDLEAHRGHCKTPEDLARIESAAARKIGHLKDDTVLDLARIHHLFSASASMPATLWFYEHDRADARRVSAALEKAGPEDPEMKAALRCLYGAHGPEVPQLIDDFSAGRFEAVEAVFARKYPKTHKACARRPEALSRRGFFRLFAPKGAA